MLHEEKPQEAFRVTPVPLDVSALKEVVKAKMDPALDYCAAPSLLVWSSFSRAKPERRPGGADQASLAPETVLVGADKNVHGCYFWVEAPAKLPA